MKCNHYTIFVILAVLVLFVGLFIGSNGVSADSKDEIVYEQSENVSEGLLITTKFFSNMSVKSEIQHTGSEPTDVKIRSHIQHREVGNITKTMAPGDEFTYEKSMKKYMDPTSNEQNVNIQIEGYPITYQYDRSSSSYDSSDIFLPEIKEIQMRQESNSRFLDVTIAHRSPHTIRQAIYVHTADGEYDTILSEQRANNTVNNNTPIKIGTVEMNVSPKTDLNGTLWHYQGFIDDNTVLTKVEFTETEQGELDVEYVEPSPISLETDNVHKTPTGLEQAQAEAQSTADRWLVNERTPAALVAGVLLVVSYVALRRRNVL